MTEIFHPENKRMLPLAEEKYLRPLPDDKEKMRREPITLCGGRNGDI